MNVRETSEIRELSADETHSVAGGAVVVDELMPNPDDAGKGARFIGSLLSWFVPW
jgi:hypothetical protein